MENNNPTPTFIILENATTMSEMKDSIEMTTNNSPSGPIMLDSMVTTPSIRNPSTPPHDLDSTFSHIKAEKLLCLSFTVSSSPNMNLSPIISIKTSHRICMMIQNDMSTPS